MTTNSENGTVQGAVATWCTRKSLPTRRQVATAPCTVPIRQRYHQSRVFFVLFVLVLRFLWSQSPDLPDRPEGGTTNSPPLNFVPFTCRRASATIFAMTFPHDWRLNAIQTNNRSRGAYGVHPLGCRTLA